MREADQGLVQEEEAGFDQKGLGWSQPLISCSWFDKFITSGVNLRSPFDKLRVSGSGSFPLVVSLSNHERIIFDYYEPRKQ